MKRKFTKVLLSLFIFLIFPFYVNAASSVATFSLTKNVDKAKPKGSFTVTVNLKNNSETDNKNSLNGYTLKVTYDKNYLSCNEDSGNSGVINLSENANQDIVTSKDITTLNFRVLDNAPAGSTNISLEGTCIIDGETDTDKRCEYNSTTLKIESLGSDSTLSSLKIPNTTLSPSFSKDVTSYSTSITDITELTVNATPSDPNAYIEITDNYRNLQEGDNKIQVVVTSEDGNSSRTYTINVKLTITPTEEELLKQDASLKELTVKGQTINFDPTEKKYYLTVDYDVQELEITAKPTNENAKVNIEGNNKLIVGKNTIKITVSSEDESKTEDYQILVTRNDEQKEVVQICPNTTTALEWIIFSTGLFVIFTAGIVLGYILCKKDVLKKIFTKKKKISEEPIEVETFSDTINLDETVKEVSNKKKKK